MYFPFIVLQQIMTVPRLSDRLECMLFRRRLDIDVSEIRPDLDIVHSATKELRSSTKFKIVLQVSASQPVKVVLPKE